MFERGRLTRGPEVDAFESEFASYSGATYGVAASSGTTALHTALEALELGPGDRVATTPFSFVASANAIRWCGAEPAFVDVRPDTYNIDLHRLEERLKRGERIDALLAVHAFGLACDVEHLLELAEAYDFDVIEDAAQAHGATYDGERVGSFGDVACFSFFATKNMTTGEGGMIVTDRSDVADRARRFIDHGRAPGGFSELGHNFCLSDIAAAIGRVQLEKLPELTALRRSNAEYLTENLRDSPVRPPFEPEDRGHVYHLYTIRTDSRDRLREYLVDVGIQVGTYYDTPIHEQPAYSGTDVSLPTVNSVKDTVLSLPVHPGLAEDDLEEITSAVGDHFGDRN